MKITITTDTDGGEKVIGFSNDNLDNFNFVDLTVGDREYTISVDDLVAIAETFRLIRKLCWEREERGNAREEILDKLGGLETEVENLKFDLEAKDNPDII